MVHGIGQRLEKSNLVDDVGDFRHVTAGLAERHLTSYQRSTQRVLFIPCQWRKGLKLSGEHSVDKCTLDGVRKLRVMLSATVHDVLYYMSPIYCQAIIDSVSDQLNRLYLKFLKRNPGYDGKISIYGHSLGSVLSYDILCHQDTLSSPFPMKCMYMEEKDEQSQPSISSELYLTSNVENKGFVDDESNSCMESADKQETHAESSFQGQGGNNGESSCSPASPAAPSHLEETTMMDFDENEPSGASVTDQSISELNNDGNDIISYEMGTTDEAMNMNTGVSESHAKQKAEEMLEGDKDRTIQLLREEIDLLKAQVKELEHECKGILEESEIRSNKATTESPPPGPSGDFKSYTPNIRYTKLEFKVDTFFAVGSPLGVFLSLRNVRIGIGKGQNYWEEENVHEEMPACRQMFNIFHPFDPVAYRVEPLICKEYVDKRPVIVPYHRGGKRLYVGFQEFKEGLASRSQAVMDHLGSVRVKVLTICESRNKDSLDEGSENVQGKEERSYGSIMMERVTGSKDGRVDHSLQDKTFRHPYLSAIGSHTNYWRDPDTALFILKHLYRDIPEEPGSAHEPQGGSSKDESSSGGWSDQRDEDLPLTFADRIFVKDFSLSARKLMKL